MGKIHVLNNHLVQKIAAGEIVERPSSVVKELIENSIDAGAKRILIDVCDGGKSLIKISDDGSGMGLDDALLALKNHATSKIGEDTDLFNIQTFGFRGEALSSISSISRLELRTSTVNEGIKLEFTGGRLTRRSPWVMPKGTTIKVCDLFFNTPARLNNMKTVQTELRHITDTVTKYAVAYPEIYFELADDKRPIIHAPAGSPRDRLATLFGKMAKDLLKISYYEKLEITGFQSGRGQQFQSRKYQEIFVNRRPVISRTIRDAIYQAYHTMLNVGKHPVFFININVNPGEVDVNVHPQKLTVRFGNEVETANAVREAFRKTLAVHREPEKALETSHGKLENLDKYTIVQEKQEKFVKKSTHNFRILGSILHTYVIVSTAEGMIVVDQHAAQERVNYEKFMMQFKDNQVVTQRLLEPIVIETSPAESVLISQYRDLFLRLGFDVSDFGRNSFLLRTVPVIFKKLQGRDAFLTIIDELRIGRTKKFDKIKEEQIIRKACRSSIKAHDKLEYNELVEVVNDLFLAKNPHTCPHGRPTMIRFTSLEFEKMFRRRI